MSNVVGFESRDAQIRQAIEAEVVKARASDPLKLPGRNDPIVRSYVQKIEGSYNVERAKIDTDNAIDLLYIAYNTTPQQEDPIRIKIGGIMDRLIEAQQESERTMTKAMKVADNVLGALKNILPDWQDVKDEEDAEEIKGFAAKDLAKLANEIKTRALGIKDQLLAIAKTYDGIIADTVAATASSETALGGRLREKAAIEKEIREADAERERLDSLVKDLQEEVKKFDKMARDYEARATTAEERAFVLQIVKIGAEVIAAAIPPIAMAASGGGASLLAASALNSATKSGSKPDKPDKPDKPKDDTAEVIRTKGEISKKKAELKVAEAAVAEGKGKVKTLRKELNKEQGKPAEAVSEADEAVKPDDSAAVKGIKERLKTAKGELKTQEDKSKALIGALAGLQASLQAAAAGIGELSQEQKDQAASLREMQMKMLDKAEAYETERRNQAAELVKIKALLKGKRTEEETIQLAIKSLNISLSALKRTKEIVEEIAFFFKSFADFMDQVAQDAQTQIELINNAASKATLRKNALANLIQSTDEFFITQAGQWHATHVVTDKFNRTFADGWSKLNKLNGKYITGDELGAYLQTASVLLQKIADEREEAAKQKILDLDRARQQLREDAMGDGSAAA
jgi:hypothetical protein